MSSLSILPSKIDRYLLSKVRPRHSVLIEMENYAKRNRFSIGGGKTISFPIIGPLMGHFISHYTKLIGAKRVFELGSGYGYSAFWFAQAMGRGGKVVCTDNRKENKEQAIQYFKKAGLASRIDFYVGDGLSLLKQEKRLFDIVFIDMEKERYPLAFKTATSKIRSGGLLIADNVLWSGRVLQKAKDKSTKGLQQFTKLITSSRKFETVILPLRDGVSVSLKR